MLKVFLHFAKYLLDFVEMLYEAVVNQHCYFIVWKLKIYFFTPGKQFISYW